MVDRALKIYQGEDLSPVTDLTDMIAWESAEFGTRAYSGEATNSNVLIRDEDGVIGNSASLPAGLTAISVAAGNTLEFTHGSNVLWRGRVATKDFNRGAVPAGRYREVSAYLEDVNVDLRGIVVHGWSRPAETDVARVQALIARYLTGSPRASTIVNGSNLVAAGSNTVTLPSKQYDRTDVGTVLAEIARTANKTYYLLPRRTSGLSYTAELFYDGNDAVMERCPYHITDREDEVRASPDHYFFPIWNVGSAATENGQELISGVWLFYNQNDYIHVSDDTQANLYIHREVVVFADDVSTAAEATARANAYLYFRKYEERTINVTIGPLTDDHVGSIRAGQTIGIKAHPIAFADDQEYDGRISQFKLTTFAPGRYFAHLQIDRPWRLFAYGEGNKATTTAPKPAQPGAAASCSLAEDQMTAISTPNGDFESGFLDSWGAPAEAADLGDPQGVGGSYYHEDIGIGANHFTYLGWVGVYTFKAGQTYVARCYIGSATGGAYLRFGDVDNGDYTEVTLTIGGANDADQTNCVEWTPAADSSNVEFWHGRAGSGTIAIDNLRAFAGSSADSTITLGGPGDASTGDPGTYIPAGTVIEHGDLSGKGGTMHDASQIEVTDSAANFTGDDVESVLAELQDNIDAIDTSAAPSDTTALFPGSSITATKDASNPTFNFEALPENIVKVGTTYYAVYGKGAQTQICLATATDRDGPWTAYASNPIYSVSSVSWKAAGVDGIYSPFLVEDGGTFYLFYAIYKISDGSLGSIGVATASSITGPYTDHGSAILSAGTSGAWDDLRVGEPAVLHHDGRWVMAYLGETGTTGTGEKIGIATATSPTGTWTKAAGNPLLGWGTSGEWDDALTADPHLFFENGYYWMMYAGAGDQPATSASQGLAYALDPTGTWTRYSGNPILSPGASGAWDDVWAFRGCIWIEDGLIGGIYTGHPGGAITGDKGGNFRLTVTAPSGGVTDHGALTGLADDDHTQYLNSSRHTTTDHSAVGHYEILMAAGSATPLETADGLDYLYVWVT